MRSALIATDELVNAYHAIIEGLEAPKIAGVNHPIKTGQWYPINDVEYILTKDEVTEFLLANGYEQGKAQKIFNELLARGFLLELNSYDGRETIGYRSLHMDVLVRSSEIRTAPWASRYLLSTRFALVFTPMPSQSDRQIQVSAKRDFSNGLSRELYEAALRFFNGDVSLTETFFRALHEHVQGLDAYQVYALRELLASGEKDEVFVISAPTGSGKTEVFLLFALAWLLRKHYIEKRKDKVLLVYPRKALTVDQAFRVISLLDKAVSLGLQLRVGISDGDTPRKANLKGEIGFRGIRCPKCGAPLKLTPQGQVKCDKCGPFSFVKAVREEVKDADIIATNPWALEVRTLDGNPNDLNAHALGDVGLLVVDEAHEYTGIRGGIFAALINLLRFIREQADGGRGLRIIVSSATIPSPEEFASKLTGVPVSKVRVLTYETVLEEYPRAISGRRLVILGLFSMKPQYSWNTYCQLWAVLTTFLSHSYEQRKHAADVPTLQSVIFVNNIKELRRVKSGYLNNLSLGEPRDHLDPQRVEEPTNPFCYWHYAPAGARDQLRQAADSGDLQKHLEKRLAEIYSELSEQERASVIRRLKGHEALTILSTSSLEIGVDYEGVAFILNAGLENPISLVQRIGRGGRSDRTLRTVAGIILGRPIITEAFLLSSKDYRETLASLSVAGDKYKLRVTTSNPRVQEREAIMKCVAKLALEGESTYASKKAIAYEQELIDFLEKILNCLEKIESEKHG
jgi:DEAD/DEAH box helicase domain-containing protein